VFEACGGGRAARARAFCSNAVTSCRTQRCVISLAMLAPPRALPSAAAPLRAASRRSGSRSRTAAVPQALFSGLEKLFKGDPSDRTRQAYSGQVAAVNSFAAACSALTDDQLRAKTDEFKARLAAGATLDSLLPEAFAVRLAARLAQHAPRDSEASRHLAQPSSSGCAGGF
jgi:SecA DEAD-like domain